MKKLLGVIVILAMLSGFGAAAASAADAATQAIGSFDEYFVQWGELADAISKIMEAAGCWALFDALSREQQAVLGAKMLNAGEPYNTQASYYSGFGDYDAALAWRKKAMAAGYDVFQAELKCQLPDEAWQLLGENPDNHKLSAPFWQEWPEWLKWVFKVLFFGWIWMR